MTRGIATTRGVVIGPLIVFVCLGIMLQVLGVPATLLDPDGFHDVMEASVLEGSRSLPFPIFWAFRRCEHCCRRLIFSFLPRCSIIYCSTPLLSSFLKRIPVALASSMHPLAFIPVWGTRLLGRRGCGRPLSTELSDR